MADVEEDADLLRFCTALPKVELHAHLNGSVRHSTLIELARARPQLDAGGQAGGAGYTIPETTDRTLEECFQLFPLIHALVRDQATLHRITTEMIEDFAEENTCYLEIRTTPKADAAMSKRAYVETVLAAMEAARARLPAIRTALLLTVNRSESLAEARETVALAVALRDRGVVGVDLAGNPRCGALATWAPALREAAEAGLPLALHFAEVANAPDALAMLALRPTRVGHACCLDTEELRQRLWAQRVPVEVCLTSNVRTRSAPSYDGHHLAELLARAHPVALCTDDRGVFVTSLSREYYRAARAFGLSRARLFELAEGAVDLAFAAPALKAELHALFRDARPRVLPP